MNIPIIYQDTDLLVINKPSGITVNRAETTQHEVTIQDWIDDNFRFQYSELEIEKQDDFFKRSGIVHRLDKETSGILLIAKNKATFEHLQKQFKDRMVKKTYLALAHGKVTPLHGEINVPVGRLPWNRNRFGILPGGKESKTVYTVLHYYQDTQTNETLSFVELYPQSGRTHQIRVHLKYIGHAIFADFLYAGRKTARKDRKILPRVFLHASKIGFQHPGSDQDLAFESPLPAELSKLLEQMSVTGEL